jgi:hypothetical protein
MGDKPEKSRWISATRNKQVKWGLQAADKEAYRMVCLSDRNLIEAVHGKGYLIHSKPIEKTRPKSSRAAAEKCWDWGGSRRRMPDQRDHSLRWLRSLGGSKTA